MVLLREVGARPRQAAWTSRAAAGRTSDRNWTPSRIATAVAISRAVTFTGRRIRFHHLSRSSAMLPRGMSLRGSLDTMAMEDVLDWMDRRFVCGVLTVERGTQVRTFQLDSGYLTGSGSSDPR